MSGLYLLSTMIPIISVLLSLNTPARQAALIIINHEGHKDHKVKNKYKNLCALRDLRGLNSFAKTGLFFDTNSLTNPKMVLPELLTTAEFIHPALGGLALAGFLAAILSTVGPVNFAVVTIATKDIYQGILNKHADDQKLLATARKLVVIVSVIVIPLAIFLKGAILDAAYVSYAIRAIGAIVIILGIYARGWITSLGAKLAFVGGTFAVFFCIIGNKMGWFIIDKTFAAVAFTFLFIIVGNIWTKLRRENN